ncbi:hypothetical protein G6039_26270 [Rhodococcus aetherivorans]|nr:hypothetical protein [Rhodococcus aetherivorans]
MTDTFFGFVAHPLPVAADVFGQSGSPRPGIYLCVRCPGEDGGAPGELRRDLDQRFVDEHCDWVQIRCVGFEAEPLGLKGDGAATGERVENRRRVAVRGGEDLLAGSAQQVLVAGVFPDHQLLRAPAKSCNCMSDGVK